MSIRRTAVLSAALLFMAAINVTARQEPAPPPAQGQRTVETRTQVQPTQNVVRRAKMVLGSKVSLQGDISIGTVDDIVINDDGFVEYLVVIHNGKLVAVPWEAAKLNLENRTAVVNITEARFREVPTFTLQSYPNFYEPTYRTQIYKYYGLTPRMAERRAERRGDRP